VFRFVTVRILAFVLGTTCLVTPPMLAAAEPQKVTVIGGSGMIGQRVVREALERGHHVTLLVRDPAKVTERHERLKVARGDVLESEALTTALAGQDVVISAVGAARAKDPDYLLYLRAAHSLTTALRAMGDVAPRLLVVGGVGSLRDLSGNMILDRVPKDRRPEHLGQMAALNFYRTVEDVRWTYLSPPGRIAPGPRTGVYRTGQDELVMNDKGESSISMEDYAVAMLDELEKPRHVRKRFTVAY
jgi:uncharacterized protein